MPQLFESVFVAVSQPFAALPSQLPKPTLQAPRPQVPAVQVGEFEFGNEHAMPQPAAPPAPQCAGLVRVLVSQPLLSMLSQFPRPALHAMLHAPPLHDGVPPVLGQALLQAAADVPQCVTSVRIETSQPSAATPLQSAVPPPQVSVEKPQTPMLQVAVPPLAGGGHTWPHAAAAEVPQLAVFAAMLTSQPSTGLWLQSAKPALQLPMAQRPLAQVAPALANWQRLPQAPQFITSVVVAISQPLVALPSQFAKPVVQLARLQTEAMQPVTAFGSVHAWPQVAQFVGSVVRSWQVVPQSVWPRGHWIWQNATRPGTPPSSGPERTHCSPVDVWHVTPQAPQFWFVVRSVHAPPQTALAGPAHAVQRPPRHIDMSEHVPAPAAASITTPPSPPMGGQQMLPTVPHAVQVPLTQVLPALQTVRLAAVMTVVPAVGQHGPPVAPQEPASGSARVVGLSIAHAVNSTAARTANPDRKDLIGGDDTRPRARKGSDPCGPNGLRQGAPGLSAGRRARRSRGAPWCGPRPRRRDARRPTATAAGARPRRGLKRPSP